MKAIKILFAVLLIGFWGCSPNVSTSMEATQKLNSYKTYAWMQGDQKPQNPVYNSEMIDNQIVNTVNQELNSKGYTQSDTNPDFYVRYKTYVEKETNLSGGYYGPGYGWGSYYGYGGWGWGWGGGPVSTYTTNEGTLVIEAIDAKTNQVIWRGFKEGNVDKPKKLNVRIEKGVKSIMEDFPS